MKILKERKRIFTIVTVIFAIMIMLPASIQAAGKVKLNLTNKTMNVGEKITLKVKGAKEKAKWKSSNKKIATVTSKGKVTAKKEGKVTITAKVGKKTLKCKIIVKNSTNNNATLGEQNALKKAKLYLEIMPFSYVGLIKQLEYEGYSHKEATYGADNCGANWYEQAAKKAKKYLEIMPFSKEGLIKQLEYEGFTHEQAVYGAKKNGY